MRGELIGKDTVSLFYGGNNKRGRVKTIEKSIDFSSSCTFFFLPNEGNERVEEIRAWSDAARSFEHFIIIKRCFFFSTRSFPTNSFLITIRAEPGGDEYLHFLVYRVENVCVDVCLRRKYASLGE